MAREQKCHRGEWNGDYLLTAREVARMLAVGPVTVHHMAARGDLPGGIKFGRNTYRWRRSAVVGWIAAQQPGPACASRSGAM